MQGPFCSVIKVTISSCRVRCASTFMDRIVGDLALASERVAFLMETGLAGLWCLLQIPPVIYAVPTTFNKVFRATAMCVLRTKIQHARVRLPSRSHLRSDNHHRKPSRDWEGHLVLSNYWCCFSAGGGVPPIIPRSTQNGSFRFRNPLWNSTPVSLENGGSIKRLLQCVWLGRGGNAGFILQLLLKIDAEGGRNCPEIRSVQPNLW